MSRDGSRRRRLYRPDLIPRADGDFEQRFAASGLEVEETEDYTALTFGADAPLHILTLTLPPPGASDADRRVNVEFNDQGNDTDSLESIELGPDYLRVTFDGGLQAGRASVADDDFEDERPAEDDELFADVERFDDVRVTSICVRFELDARQFATLKKHLERCSDLFDLDITGPFAETVPAPRREPLHALPPIEVEISLDVDVIDGFCYGQPWARALTDEAKLRVLGAIRELYEEALRIPPGYEVEWNLVSDKRLAGPALSIPDRVVSDALDRAGEELRFGDASADVIGRLRAAALAEDGHDDEDE